VRGDSCRNRPPTRYFVTTYDDLFSQWPTFITLITFPILVRVYVKLAQREEIEPAETHEKNKETESFEMLTIVFVRE